MKNNKKQREKGKERKKKINKWPSREKIMSDKERKESKDQTETKK